MLRRISPNNRKITDLEKQLAKTEASIRTDIWKLSKKLDKLYKAIELASLRSPHKS